MASEPTVVRVVDGPVVYDGELMRVVELSDGSGRSEVWGPKGWTVGASPADVLRGTPVSASELAAFGVPSPESSPTPPNPSSRPYVPLSREDYAEIGRLFQLGILHPKSKLRLVPKAASPSEPPATEKS